MAGASDGRRSDRASRVVRTRGADVRTLTLDEAAIEVGKRYEGFLVFRDSATERVGVLFRRRDGRLGLVEPEA
jgi:putative sigma-54 modulation protein